MWRCVDLASTDVSEELIASIFRVEKSASGEPAWAGPAGYVPPKRRLTQDLHSVTSQKTTLFIVTAVKASNHTNGVMDLPITVAARSKTWTCLRSLGSWDRGFESHSRHACLYCVSFFCVCVVLCVGRGLATGWSPVQGVLPTVYRIKKLKKRPRPYKGM
jgi:hypothetical protein